MVHSSEEKEPFALNIGDIDERQSDPILITRAEDPVIKQIRKMIDRNPEIIVQALREFISKTQG